MQSHGEVSQEMTQVMFSSSSAFHPYSRSASRIVQCLSSLLKDWCCEPNASVSPSQLTLVTRLCSASSVCSSEATDCRAPCQELLVPFCHFLVQLRKYSLRLCSFQLGLKCGYETDVFFLHYQGYQHIWSLPVAPFFDSAYHFRVAAPVSWLSFFPFSVQ